MDLELLNDSRPAKRELSTFERILIYGTGGLAVGVSIICIPFVSPGFRKFCLPYVPATSVQLHGVAKALAGRSGKLLDIGSGDGRIVFLAAEKGFHAHGVELNLWLVLYSKLAAIFKPQRKNITFFRRDLWKFNLQSYDNVVIFGVEQMMEAFERKVLNELNDGAVVVACRFPLPNMVPVETIGQGIDTVWKYAIKR